MIKIWKIKLALIVFILITALTLSVNMSKGPQVSAGDREEDWRKDAYDVYSNLELSWDEVAKEYHSRVNEIFKMRIKKVLGLKANDFLVDPPAGEEGQSSTESFPLCTAKCGKTCNLSTACVGNLAKAEYLAFAKALKERRDKLTGYKECFTDRQKKAFDAFKKTEEGRKCEADDIDTAWTYAGNECWAVLSTFHDLGSQVDKISLRKAMITDEVLTAKTALDSSLAAYNELYWAWPTHLQYEEMIRSLAKYREKLGNIHANSAVYGSKFIDASTTDCT